MELCPFLVVKMIVGGIVCSIVYCDSRRNCVRVESLIVFACGNAYMFSSL